MALSVKGSGECGTWSNECGVPDKCCIALKRLCTCSGDGAVGRNTAKACQVVDTADWCCTTVESGVAREVEGEVVAITINASSKAGVAACQCQAGVEYKQVVVGLVACGGDVSLGNS